MANQEGHTVIALKSSFMRAQVRILSQRLTPTRDWWEENHHSETLPHSIVQDVLAEVNRQTRRHNQEVYSALATRHVAEQIDKLYWNAAAPDLDMDENLDDETIFSGVLRVGDDLRQDENISKLPDVWEDEDGRALDQSETGTYDRDLKRLEELAVSRRALQQRLASYRRLLGLLEPLKDPSTSVQPNLVTRDGNLAAELSKMRALIARVSGRMGEQSSATGRSLQARSFSNQSENGGDESMSEEEEDEQEKVRSILNQ